MIKYGEKDYTLSQSNDDICKQITSGYDDFNGWIDMNWESTTNSDPPQRAFICNGNQKKVIVTKITDEKKLQTVHDHFESNSVDGSVSGLVYSEGDVIKALYQVNSATEKPTDEEKRLAKKNKLKEDDSKISAVRRNAASAASAVLRSASSAASAVGNRAGRAANAIGHSAINTVSAIAHAPGNVADYFNVMRTIERMKQKLKHVCGTGAEWQTILTSPDQVEKKLKELNDIPDMLWTTEKTQIKEEYKRKIFLNLWMDKYNTLYDFCRRQPQSVAFSTQCKKDYAQYQIDEDKNKYSLSVETNNPIIQKLNALINVEKKKIRQQQNGHSANMDFSNQNRRIQNYESDKNIIKNEPCFVEYLIQKEIEECN